MKLTLPYPPSTNKLYATVGKYRVPTAEYKSFKSRAAQAAKSANLIPLAGDVAIQIDIYRPKRIGDLDNRIKAVQDILKGIAWADDKQITRIVANRYEDKDNPRAEVTITPAGELA